ncbi:MAG TPA: T9SS type A sorting domain-containing protein [Rubricoccaceae bacterium]
MRLAPFALLLSVWSGAAAQVTVSPDTLFFQGETTVTVVNTSDGPVTVDSVAVRFDSVGAHGYNLQATGTGWTYGGFLSPFYEDSFVVGDEVAPGDAATVEIVGFDPCMVCLAEGGTPYTDTLVVYSGGRAVPDTVIIDFSRYVVADAGPAAATFSVEAFPNPATDGVTVRVGEGVGAEVSVVDARGRVVRRSRVEAGAEAVRVDTGGLAPGAYTVRATAADGRRASSRFVVVR